VNRTGFGIVALCVSVGAATAATALGAGQAAAPTTPRPKPPADLRQLMRGIMFPNSNVIFAAQDDFSKLPPAADPATSPNPLTNTYGGWQAVENAALALAETSSLIAVSGRMCSSGRPVPTQRPDWNKYVRGLRDTALKAYKAAQSKDRDAIVDVSGALSDACSACHDVYREKKGGEKDRCLP
jgi:hypothetical protein